MCFNKLCFWGYGIKALVRAHTWLLNFIKASASLLVVLQHVTFSGE